MQGTFHSFPQQGVGECQVSLKLPLKDLVSKQLFTHVFEPLLLKLATSTEREHEDQRTPCDHGS